MRPLLLIVLGLFPTLASAQTCWPKPVFEGTIMNVKEQVNPDLTVYMATDRQSGIVIYQMGTPSWWETWEMKPDSGLVCVVRTGDGQWQPGFRRASQ
jgi:hypothetical protein